MKISVAFLAITASTQLGVRAHPGHSVAGEAAERAEYLSFKPRSANSCSKQLRERGLFARALARRTSLANYAQKKRGLTGNPLRRRDFATYNISHASGLDVGFGDDETLLFADNSSCLLQPEVTQGPYYVDGEMIRSDLTEDQEGVPLFLDIQFLDTSTCEPVSAVFVDLWHCNSTGVYSGVSANGNGNSNDTSNLDATFLRGIQQTDINGVVQFETLFPGHYTGRATHIHVMSHAVGNTTVRTNGTILGSNGTAYASHVGQIFFDQDLISQVEATEPYSSNTQDVTQNSDDSILGEEVNSMDPFVEYIFIGDKIEDGILAWITIGIDPDADNAISSAATMYKDGGVANENSMGGGPGGDANGGPPNGTSGAVPTGAPPSR